MPQSFSFKCLEQLCDKPLNILEAVHTDIGQRLVRIGWLLMIVS